MSLNPLQQSQIQKQIELYEQQESTQKVTVPFSNSTLELEVEKYVANPNIMNSGIQVVQYLVDNPDIVRDKIITDMGTGCGIIGIVAALLGAKKVYMPEIDDRAVENAKRNIALHGLENICEVFQSDLFENYGTRQPSQVQIFNHPFFPFEPIDGKDWTRIMLGGTELIRRYFEQAKDYAYSAKGAIYIMPWFTLAENDFIDNDPAKRAVDLEVTKVTGQVPVKQGVQQALFKIYELRRKN